MVNEFIENLEKFYRSRQLVFELESDEFPLAVITVKRDCDQACLTRLAQWLESWQSSHCTIKRILGLENMQKGERPEVATSLLGIPMFGHPGSWVSPVALVTLKKDQLLVQKRPLFQNTQFNVMCRDEYGQSLLDDLRAGINNHGHAHDVDIYFYEMYSSMLR